MAIRITAAQALGNIGRDAAAAIPVLKALLSDRDIVLRKHAEAALSRIECKVTTAGCDNGTNVSETFDAEESGLRQHSKLGG